MKPLCVLNVDDDDVDREKLSRLLLKTSWPIDVHEAASFAEAKDRLNEKKFDCVFLDYSLGDATGFDVIPAVQQHRSEICPIIMISTSGSEQLVVEAMREGVYDYISKSGLNREQLQRSIDGSLHWVAREMELRESRRRIEYLSLYDALTGLPNRTLLFDRLDQQIRSSERDGSMFSLLMMDLNLFKEVNDSLGHDAGDFVLKEVAHRILNSVRSSDTVARLAGDEFACLLPTMDEIDSCRAVAEKIIAAIHAPIQIGEETISVSISIGIALYPTHAATSHALLKCADQAMYQAKKWTKGIQVYSDSVATFTDNPSVLLSNRLERAIGNHEFLLYFQPQISLTTGELIGKEALARWRQSDQKLYLPNSFIPAAEKSAVIYDLTYELLRIALDQESAWRAKGIFVPVPVSVNISARLLDDESFPSRVMSMLQQFNLPVSCLTLELTETALFAAPSLALNSLRSLSESGLRISIDDFGSGYTSLKQLRDLEIAEIKIDGLYVQNITATGRDASIVRSIVELGHGFNIQVIAECVELKETWDLLRKLGCNCAQGYSIAAPMSLHDYEQWISQWSDGSKIRS